MLKKKNSNMVHIYYTRVFFVLVKVFCVLIFTFKSLSTNMTYKISISEPPKFENTLPDLYRLLETMEKEEGDLSNKKQPPSLFSRPEHVDKYQKISSKCLCFSVCQCFFFTLNIIGIRHKSAVT